MRRIIPFVLIALLAGCGGDDGAGGTTTTAESTTTTEPVTTTSEATTTTGGAADGCDAPAVATDAEERIDVEGDVDGDGTDDTVTSFRDSEGVHLTVELANGAGRGSVILASAEVGAVGGLQGIVDINGDGAGEIWAIVGSGAAALLYEPFIVEGCAPKPILLNSAPAVFAVGGSVNNAAGVRCDDLDGNGALDEVVRLEASSTDGENFETTSTGFTMLDGEFSQLSQQQGAITSGDPGFDEFSSFACGDLTD